MNNERSGIVTSAELCQPLPDVHICRKNAQGKVLQQITSDRQGGWKLPDFKDGETILFTCDGFVSRQFNHATLPNMVRLLEDKLIGYQNTLWFVPGETVDTFVHAPVSYTAKLFRHGFLKKLVADIGLFPAQTQLVPDGYFVDTGLDWHRNFAYTIPEHAKPGLYSLLLESHGQEPFAIPMVVSTPEAQYGTHTKLLVLVSTNTWQSYNLWGGRSRYRNFEDRASTEFCPSMNPWRKMVSLLLPLPIKTAIKRLLRRSSTPASEPWNFKQLTIRRPFTNCALEEEHVFQPFTNHLAAAEWRLLAWLEREGYEYDIVTGYDLHKNPDLLKNYAAIILSTHSEYWTRKMYEGLLQQHEQHRLWVLNISGNSIYREIDFFEDGSTRCMSLSFADSCADETQLLGVRFTPHDYGTCAPYTIVQPTHWAFSNIRLSHDKRFGGLSLNQRAPQKYSRYDPGRPGAQNDLEGMGASGWETDKLSATAPRDIQRIAKGLNRYGGADMVIREPSGTRGGMFSASSITFGASLLIDQVASTLIKNVLYQALHHRKYK